MPRRPVDDRDPLLLEAPHLFDRPGNPYLGPDGADWPDNHLRFGALSEEAKIALARGAQQAGTGICSGEGGMLAEEQAEKVRKEILDRAARKLETLKSKEIASGHDAQRGGMDPALLGMMLFIASEIMFFAALFAANAFGTFWATNTEVFMTAQVGIEASDPWDGPHSSPKPF